MVDIGTYRCRIGLFNLSFRKARVLLELFTYLYIFPRYVYLNFIKPQILLQSNDIEQNPGPNTDTVKGTFSFCHFNARSILARDQQAGVSKFEELCSLTSTEPYNLIAITETWLDDSIANNDLLVPGYLPPLRRDRSRTGGGVMVYLASDLPAKRRPDLEPNNCEIMCIEIQLRGVPTLMCVCYRPPNSDTATFLEGLHNVKDSADPDLHMIFVGDFNAKHSLWCTNDVTCTNGRRIKICFDAYGLTQLISQPTRFGNTSSSCIDLIFTDIAHLFKSVDVLPPISNCDHCPIVGHLQINCARHKAYKRHVWNYKRGDYDKFRALLNNEHWESVLSKASVNEMCTEFTEVFSLIASECVPNYVCTIRPRDKPWINNTVRKSIRKRNRLYKKLKRHDCEVNQAEYRVARNNVVSVIRAAKREHEERIMQTISNEKSTSKNWWKCLKQLRGNAVDDSIPPLVVNDRIINDNTEKSNIFNDFFASHSTLDPLLDTDPGVPPPSNSTIQPLVLTSFEIFKILSALDTNKATGPDGISNKLLREAAPSISDVLAKIFNKSLESSTYPDIWKMAHVVPLHKKNSQSDPNNYRPVSLLTCISKILEKAVYKYVHNYLISNNLITKKQSGFSPGDSTINQLTCICHQIYESFDNRDETRAVFLDLSKAFDKVWHRGLLYKMETMGIHGTMLSWFRSYLSGRRQKVVLGGSESNINTLTCGVPQGSVLGPLLFLIYINDLVENLECDSFLFADDTSLFKRLHNDSASAADSLNRDLEKINLWCQKWLLHINVGKTKDILFSRKRQPSNLPPLYFNNLVIETVSSHKQLGIILDAKLDWSEHIEDICSRSLQRINAWKGLQFKLSRKHLETCLTLFVLPILDYGDILYDNCSEANKEDLEAVHIAAARVVTGAKRYTSHQLLYNDTGWTPLRQRREAHKLLKIYDIIHNHTPAYLKSILPRNLGASTHRTRGASANNFIPYRCKTELLRKSFFPSSLNLFYTLPPSERSPSTRNAFRRTIKQSMKNTVTTYFYSGPRKFNVVLAQMRLEFSDLNDHLYSKGCVESPLCQCGHGNETIHHYLFDCNAPTYAIPRQRMLTNLRQLVPPNVLLNSQIILGGIEDGDVQLNANICEAVCRFLLETNRF